jgi:iron complex transport system substrate-binding protein
MTDPDKVSRIVIGSALRVHTRLGPGLFESVYQKVLCVDLRAHGLFVESKKLISFEFEGHHFKDGFEADIVVERCLVVEVKSVLALAPIFEKQLLTYLRLLDYRVGLLINFNTVHLKNGIKRMVNNY